jgi:hypothetical protein
VGEPLRVGVCTFRRMNGPFTGVVYVIEGLPRHRGARMRHRQAETKSRASLAGPSDGSGYSDGGSANTSNARSSGRTNSAGPADGSGDGPKRAPIAGGGDLGGPDGTTECPAKALQPMKELPGTKWGLTKAVNEEAQIVPVIGGLLRSKDEKVQLRMVELLIDTAYSENSGRDETGRPGRIEWSIPRPKRD